ncbi:MAG: hypothetical protein FH748_15215 [Balneolaceae bacterium]|nr:hypothetical protein [Balneolaceae bacterium]
MKCFKSIFRYLRLMLLIVLVCFGIGIAGGIPIPISHKKDPFEAPIELVEEKDDEEEEKKEKS